MNPGGVHPELLDQVIHQELHEEEIIEAGHPFLAGGGRLAPLAAVVALVLAPRLPATGHVTRVWSWSLPVSVTHVSVHARVIINVP